MRKISLICVVIVLLFITLCSCNNNVHQPTSNDNSNYQNILEPDKNNFYVPNESDNDSLTTDTNPILSDKNSKDEILENANNVDNLTKNIKLHTTSIGNEYYPMIYVGNYLGTDMPHDIGNYYKEILSFDDLCTLVEHPEKIDKDLFQENFIFVVKRVSDGYFADIGFKSYDAHFHKIELDSFSISQGTDDVKVRFDYIVIPKYKAQMDEDHCLVGNLGINENIKSYYAVGTEQKIKGNVMEQSKHFKNLKTANSYLTSYGYDEIPNHNYNDASILLLCLNISVDKYESPAKSCYLGFKDFNVSASDVYITLERNIINEDYGNNTEYYVFAIIIPNKLLCVETIENPTIHILVHDNISKIVS